MGLQREEDESYYIDSESYYYEILKLDSDEPAEPGRAGAYRDHRSLQLRHSADPFTTTAIWRWRSAGRRTADSVFISKNCTGAGGDMIYDTKGRIVSPFVLLNGLSMAKGISQYRFIQEDIRKYTLWLNGEKKRSTRKPFLILSVLISERTRRSRWSIWTRFPVLNSGKRKSFENRCEKYAVKPGAKA